MAVSNEEKMLKERIRHLLTYKRASVASLADNENERVRLRHQINDDALVQYSTLYKLLYMFHDIDANWLIMGEGYMQKKDNIAPKVYQQHNEVKGNTAGGDINVGPDTIVTSNTVERLESELAEKTKRISELEQDKMYLQHLVDSAYPHLNIKK